jgi:hypothetical protein
LKVGTPYNPAILHPYNPRKFTLFLRPLDFQSSRQQGKP